MGWTSPRDAAACSSSVKSAGTDCRSQVGLHTLTALSHLLCSGTLPCVFVHVCACDYGFQDGSSEACHSTSRVMSVILFSALLVCKVSCSIQYTRSELLNLRSISHSDLGPSTSLLVEKLQDFNISSHSTPAKKCHLSGTFARFRGRPYRPPLPALLLSNVRSLRHKMDELQLMIQTNKDYSECSAICLTKTLLDQSVPYQAVTLPGITLNHADRSSKLSRKAKGGGVRIMIN